MHGAGAANNNNMMHTPTNEESYGLDPYNSGCQRMHVVAPRTRVEDGG